MGAYFNLKSSDDLGAYFNLKSSDDLGACFNLKSSDELFEKSNRYAVRFLKKNSSDDRYARGYGRGRGCPQRFSETSFIHPYSPFNAFINFSFRRRASGNFAPLFIVTSKFPRRPTGETLRT